MKNLLMFVAVIFSFQALAQKKVLDHTSFDSWEAIKEVSLHPNGIFVVYVIAPQ